MSTESTAVVSNYPRDGDLSQVSVAPEHALAAVRVAPWLLAWTVAPTLMWSVIAFTNDVVVRGDSIRVPVAFVIALVISLSTFSFLRDYIRAARYDSITNVHAWLLFMIGMIPGIGIISAYLLHVWVCRDLQQKGFPPLRGRIPTTALRDIVNRARRRGEL